METAFPAPRDDAERTARLRLYRTRNIGPVTFRKLLLQFGTARAALDALPELARRGGLREFKPFPAARAETELSDLAALGGQALHIGATDYPKLLTVAEDAPPVLMPLGDASLLQRSAIAIVGARNASANGRTLATAFADELSATGYVIVSGMARGIDTAAHAGALNGGTIAVVAGGVDIIYPRENSELYHRILDGGLVVSEMPSGTKPQERHFPRRNRIISGLSLRVVVVEAAERSGSLTTARFAAEQGRDVLAVPGSPLDPRTHGTGRLIRDGATLVMSTDHILEALQRLQPIIPPSPIDAPHDHKSEPNQNVNSTAIHAPVLELMSYAPPPIDDIVRLCDSPPAVVRAALLELEIAGRIHCLSGNFVTLRRDG